MQWASLPVQPRRQAHKAKQLPTHVIQQLSQYDLSEQKWLIRVVRTVLGLHSPLSVWSACRRLLGRHRSARRIQRSYRKYRKRRDAYLNATLSCWISHEDDPPINALSDQKRQPIWELKGSNLASEIREKLLYHLYKDLIKSYVNEVRSWNDYHSVLLAKQRRADTTKKRSVPITDITAGPSMKVVEDPMNTIRLVKPMPRFWRGPQKLLFTNRGGGMRWTNTLNAVTKAPYEDSDDVEYISLSPTPNAVSPPSSCPPSRSKEDRVAPNRPVGSPRGGPINGWGFSPDTHLATPPHSENGSRCTTVEEFSTSTEYNILSTEEIVSPTKLMNCGVQPPTFSSPMTSNTNVGRRQMSTRYSNDSNDIRDSNTNPPKNVGHEHPSALERQKLEKNPVTDILPGSLPGMADTKPDSKKPFNSRKVATLAGNSEWYMLDQQRTLSHVQSEDEADDLPKPKDSKSSLSNGIGTSTVLSSKSRKIKSNGNNQRQTI